MSLHGNTPDDERRAERFHIICAAIGVSHLLIGGLMLLFHLNGANDHRKNREELERIR